MQHRRNNNNEPKVIAIAATAKAGADVWFVGALAIASLLLTFLG